MAFVKTGLQTKPFVQWESIHMWGFPIGTCMGYSRKSIHQVMGLTKQSSSGDVAGLGVAKSEHEDNLLQILQTCLQGVNEPAIRQKRMEEL